MSHCPQCYQHDGKHVPECPNGVGRRPHKYRAEATMIDGIRFPSKKEAKRFCELQFAQRSGELLFFLRQVPFHLKCGARYVADFLEIWRNGQIVVSDVKGFKTKEYRLKKRLVESEYPIRIQEV